MSNLPSWYDSWKTHDPASEEAEPDICETCAALMEWVDDVDVVEETGIALIKIAGKNKNPLKRRIKELNERRDIRSIIRIM
jgi:hypothetical protein